MVTKEVVKLAWLNVGKNVRASTNKPLFMFLPVFQNVKGISPNPAQVLLDDVKRFVEQTGRKDHHVRTVYPSLWTGHLFDETAIGALALSLYSENLTELAIKQGEGVKNPLDLLMRNLVLTSFERFALETLFGETVYASDMLIFGVFSRLYRARKGTVRFADKVVNYLINTHGYVPLSTLGEEYLISDDWPLKDTHDLQIIGMKKVIPNYID